jgi:hypothetical protein
MASSDLQPWVYDFKYSYYENFYNTRLQQMSQSGDFYHMWKEGWNPQDSVKALDGVLVNNGVDISHYVHKHYNGDVPLCLTEKLVREIDRIINDPDIWLIASIFPGGIGVMITLAITRAVVNFLNKIFGSFIVTATVNALDHECAVEFIEKLKNYRDATMTSKEAKNMLRYYKVIGPMVVDSIEEDPLKEHVYKYIYAEYLSKLRKLIDDDNRLEVFHVYFMLMDDMMDRYNIKVSKRFVKWRQYMMQSAM